jgi:hypothetical protein
MWQDILKLLLLIRLRRQYRFLNHRHRRPCLQCQLRLMFHQVRRHL